jgi:hypothetical protein
MPIINIVNESTVAHNPDVFLVSQAVNIFVQQVSKAWGLTGYSVAYGLSPVQGEWNVLIVDKFPNSAMTSIALGYHELDTSGAPIAYIRANSYGSRSLLGNYAKPFVFLGKTLSPARYTPGVATVVMHEVAEMLADAHIDQYIAAPDGRQWLREICDHVSPVCYNIALPSAQVNCIAPDFTWPSFYQANGKAPYSQCNTPTAPFTLPKGAYGYYKGTLGVVPLSAAAAKVPDVE